MSINYINTGTSANAGNGDVLRTAFWKVNLNFAELNDMIVSGEFGSIVQSSTPPVTTSTSTLWYDTVGGRTYVYYDSTWVDASPTADPVNLESISTNVVPSTNLTYDLGSTSSQWRSLYVGTSTIYLGGTALSVNNGNITIDGQPVGISSTSTLINGEWTLELTNTGTLSIPRGGVILVDTSTGLLNFNNDVVLTANEAQTYRNKTYEGVFLAVTTGTSFVPYEYTQAIFVTELDGFSEVAVKNASPLSEASSDFVCYSDLGDGNTFYIDMGMNSSNYSSGDYPIFPPSSGYLYTGGGVGAPSDLIIGTATTGSHLKLFSGGIGTEAVRFVIHGDTGNVIIGEDANVDDGLNKLQVHGSTTITGALIVDHAIYSNCGIFVDVTATNIIFADNTVQTTAYTGGGTTSTLVAGTATLSINALSETAFPSGLTFTPIENYGFGFGGTIALQTYGEQLQVLATGTGASGLFGWGEVIGGPGGVAYLVGNQDGTNEVKIVAGSYNATVHTWKFGDDGQLTIPRDIIGSGSDPLVIQNTATGVAYLELPLDPSTDSVILANQAASGAVVTIKVGDFGSERNWTFNEFGSLAVPGVIYNNDTSNVGQLLLAGDAGEPATYLALPSDVGSTTTNVRLSNSNGGIQLYAGNNNWLFNNGGDLQLPRGGVITENVVTNELWGSTTTSLTLIPGGAATVEQRLEIYSTGGGEGNHIHITSGDQNQTDLFLGNDTQYFAVAAGGHNVIQARPGTASPSPGTQATAGNGVNIYAGDAGGNGGNVADGASGGDVFLQSGISSSGLGGHIVLQSASGPLGFGSIRLSTDNGSTYLEFDKNGVLTLPSGGAFGPEGMGASGLSNGTSGNPVYIVNKKTNGDYLANIILTAGDGISGEISFEIWNTVTSVSKVLTINTACNLVFSDASVQNTAWVGGGSSVVQTNLIFSNDIDTRTFNNTGSVAINFTAYTGGPSFNTEWAYQSPLNDSVGITVLAATIASTATSTSTTSGALTVAGGIGVGGDIVLGGNLNADSITVTSLLNLGKAHETFTTATTASSVVNYDCANNQIFYHTNTGTVANWTANFTNLNLAAGKATAISLVIKQGNTGYYPSAVQIGGAAQTLNWQGNTNPTVNANRTDVVSFTILNDSGTYTVLGQLTGF